MTGQEMEKKFNIELVYDDRNDQLEVNWYHTGETWMVIEQAIAKEGCPVHPEEDNTVEIVEWFLDKYQHEYNDALLTLEVI